MDTMYHEASPCVLCLPPAGPSCMTHQRRTRCAQQISCHAVIALPAPIFRLAAEHIITLHAACCIMQEVELLVTPASVSGRRVRYWWQA